MHRLTLAQATALIEAAALEAARLGLRPISIAILDPGANLIAFQRQDGAPFLGPKIATGKAAGAVGFGLSSRKLADIAKDRPHFIASIDMLGDGGLVAAPGGVIICDESGTVLGAIGVSGDTSDNDEACALAAIAAVALHAKP